MNSQDNVILEIKDLNQYFRDFASVREIRFKQFLSGINLKIYKNEVLGLVGESGCGKTTLGKCLVGLINTVTGNIFYNGTDLCQVAGGVQDSVRKKIQMIFQNPRSSLNINLTVRELIQEAVQLNQADPVEVQNRIDRLIQRMKLGGRESQYPFELSGGERRRVGLARVMAVDPEIVIADEPVSSLDVSIKGFIVKLLLDFRSERQATILFITHDMELVRQICDRIVVMYGGRVIEIFHAEQQSENGVHHPYTRRLFQVTKFFSETTQTGENESDTEEISAVPDGDIERCVYYAGCPLRGERGISHICEKKSPSLIAVAKNDHAIACHAFQPVPNPLRK